MTDPFMNHHDDDFTPIRDQARRFLQAALSPDYLKSLLEAPGTFDQTTWRAAAELGWPAAAVREAQGGLGLGWRGTCVLAEELGRVTASLPLIGTSALSRLLYSLEGVTQFQGTAALLRDGERHACLAFMQPGEAGLALRPTIRLSEGRLDGRSALTPFAATADYALVTAAQHDGLCLALVDLTQPGVAREIDAMIDNSRAAARLVFDAALAQVVASGTSVGAVLWPLVSEVALATAFEQIGGAEVCLETARAYALERTAFGQPIGRFQAIKNKVAEMYIRIELARGCALDALAAHEADDPAWLGLAATARLAAIDAYEYAARENIQTHGAIGITWEAQPHHDYRRSRALALEWGSAIFWRERVLAEAAFESVAQTTET
jgi:alkylation response protein AidB-like acyl-CoA dehydrogenase